MWVIRLENLYWTGSRWLHRQQDAMRFATPPDLQAIQFPSPRVVELEPLEPRLSDTSSGPDGDGSGGSH